jgi:predicted AlkP superfamily pyrophosphatase or phosphodiesterase
MMSRILFSALLLIVCVTTKAQHESVPYVILVSFDGFRYDYVKNFNPPNFKKFIANGSQAEALIPSFPSKTFPNPLYIGYRIKSRQSWIGG